MISMTNYKNFNISHINATTYSALKYQGIGRSFQELQSEEKAILEIQKATDSKESLRDFNKTLTESIVHFTDPLSNSLVSLKLTDENLQTLQRVFKTEDFYQRQDGTLRLSGDAEAFVSGWFGDIAYKRGYLEADEDRDGALNSTEMQNTRMSIVYSAAYLNKNNTAVQYGQIIDMVQYSDYKTPEELKVGQIRNAVISGYSLQSSQNTITKALNEALRQDKNQDGKITLLEHFGKLDRLVESLKGKIIEQYRLRGSLISGGDEDALEKLHEEQEKALKALQKLLANKGDKSALTPEEIKALPEGFDSKEFEDTLKAVNTALKDLGFSLEFDSQTGEWTLVAINPIATENQAIESPSTGNDSIDLSAVVQNIASSVESGGFSLLDVRV